MLKAIEELLSDESFHIPLEPAATAFRQGTCVFQWASEASNRQAFETFEAAISSALQTCLPEGTSNIRSFQTERVDLWRAYHSVRTSEAFIALWRELIGKVTSEPAEPTFFQDVMDRVFEAMVVTAFPLKESASSSSDTQNITYEDANVVRYIAGYVCRKVRTKIKESSRTNKTSLLNCLEGLLADEGEGDATASADWLDVVDRGGLLHVKEGTYMLFCAMEEEVREHFRMENVTNMTEGNREQVEGAVMDNDEVLFQWCMLTADVSDADATVVLEMLVKLWIVIRGFSFASAWLELHKQRKKKSLQRSKALRKDIH